MGDKLEYRFNYGKTDFSDAKKLRQLIFVEEQGFENEFDEIDERAYHVVVYQDNCAIATGRMYFEDEKTMILGRIAVIKEYRGTGLGSKVVKSLENKAKELNCTTVKLSAQQRAQMFYEKLGYQPIGEVYYDEWCPHITMSKNI
ncbi:MAG: GNAT family N-acetyltransferase [Thomasclavelia spiroformis]